MGDIDIDAQIAAVDNAIRYEEALNPPGRDNVIAALHATLRTLEAARAWAELIGDLPKTAMSQFGSSAEKALYMAIRGYADEQQ